jgi:hypothetical protein
MLEDKIVIEGYNDDSSTWVKLHVGDYIEVADGSFTESVSLNSADGFTVNNAVTVRVRSYDGYALNGSDSTDVIATVTMNAISGVVDGTPYTLEGDTDGDAVEIWVDDGTGYAYEGDAVVVGSAWTYDITLTVGTYGIKAIDGTDSRGYAEQTGVVVASGQVEWMQFASTGGDTIVNTTKIEEDYVYLQGTTTATNIFGEATGVGGGVTRALYVAKLNKNNFTKVWVKFYSVTNVSNGENLADDSTGNYLLFTLRISATNSVLRKIAKSDGATSSDITLDVASSTDTSVYGIMESASYYWMLGYSAVSGVYRTTFWRLAKDLTGLTTTRVQMRATSTDYAQSGCISADGNYMIMFEPAASQMALADLSSGTPVNTTKYIVAYVPYGKIVASNTKWLIHERATDSYNRFLHRSPISDIAIGSASYHQSRGATEATDRAGDTRYIGSKFYVLFYDASETKFVVERIADNDAYSLEASVDIVPNAIDTAGNVGVNTHSFVNWDGTKGLLATALEGKIHADASTSGNYDIVLKLFDLP